MMEHAATSDEEFSDGSPTPYTCPVCGGALRESEPGRDHLCFACHTGHRFTADELKAGQRSQLERSLETALRMQNERVMLLRDLEQRVRTGLGYIASDKFEDELSSRPREEAVDAERDLEQIREFLTSLRSRPNT